MVWVVFLCGIYEGGRSKEGVVVFGLASETVTIETDRREEGDVEEDTTMVDMGGRCGF